MKKHALYSPSGAVGWMNCAGFESSSGTNQYAAEGTVAHELAADFLIDGNPPESMLGQTVEQDGFEILVTQEMVDHVNGYVKFVKSLPGEHFVEVSLSLTELTMEPDAFGTADFIAVSDDEITVVDFKYGMHPVRAENNPQLMMYATAALFQYGWKDRPVTMAIYQPRISNVSGFKVQEDELKRFYGLVNDAVDRHCDPDSELTPGEAQCKYCNHAGRCEAQTNFALAAIADDFVDLTKEVDVKLKAAVDLVAHVDAPTLARMLRATDFIEQWLGSVKARSLDVLTSGNPLPGFKLVTGRAGNRKWVDEQAVIAFLSEKGVDASLYMEQSLITPARAEKALKGSELLPALLELVSRSEGKPVVAPEGDKRPTYNPTEQFQSIKGV